MKKEKVVFFLDYASINRAAREKRYRLDYHDLLCYVSEGRFLTEAYCYMPINPRNEHRADRDIETLWHAGYIVNPKRGSITGGTYRCNFGVEITMDLIKVMYQVKPDIIVLATGNPDFVPLLQEARKSGVRIEVAAFEETTSAEMLLKSSGFIDLAVYYEDYLALQKDGQSEPREERIETLYKDLIQSQEQDLQELLEDDVSFPIAQEAAAVVTAGQDEDEIKVPLPESNENNITTDELNV